MDKNQLLIVISLVVIFVLVIINYCFLDLFDLSRDDPQKRKRLMRHMMLVNFSLAALCLLSASAGQIQVLDLQTMLIGIP
ncbi:hypothetical protein [Brevibacillus reuszeri]|uniref:hypothetical protein n=1 Tax=Brevibacillus reuszeri TaxID=54915 RepID=UPI000CCC37B3|nr:hypothetical protein [Brevibacillus reuszeri]